MNRILAPLFCAALLAAGGLAASTSPVRPRFYGKIVSIDQAKRSLVAHNARQGNDETFQWDGDTGVTFQKTPMKASELKVGQSLAIWYEKNDDGNRATRIMVRTPFKKSAAQP